MKSLIGLTTEELGAVAQEAGQPAYRGKQIAAWLYKRGAETLDDMTDLPRDLRARLAEIVYGRTARLWRIRMYRRMRRSST